MASEDKGADDQKKKKDDEEEELDLNKGEENTHTQGLFMVSTMTLVTFFSEKGQLHLCVCLTSDL